ncbi:MAG: DUF3307 domain-containing protein [Clostridiaceae bacterium]
MFRKCFIILLLSHIFGDYYLQTDEMADKKEESIRWLYKHCLLYWAAYLLISIPVFSLKIFLAGLAMAILHAIVDACKFYYNKKKNKDKTNLITKRNIYIFDQGIHLACLIAAAYILTTGNVTLTVNAAINKFFDIAMLSKLSTVCYLTALLIIHKPANITIMRLIAVYKPVSGGQDGKKQRDYNAGSFIGTVERIIILIFLSIEQYSAIGLVLTAKSIARYDRISKDKDFAEYYLLGTLISTAFVTVITFLLIPLGS